jgi:hypothetical protein
MSFGGKIYKRKRKGENVKKGLKTKEREIKNKNVK